MTDNGSNDEITGSIPVVGNYFFPLGSRDRREHSFCYSPLNTTSGNCFLLLHSISNILLYSSASLFGMRSALDRVASLLTWLFVSCCVVPHQGHPKTQRLQHLHLHTQVRRPLRCIAYTIPGSDNGLSGGILAG